MVKHSTLSNPKSSGRIKIPLKHLLFWNRKIKEYICIKRKNKENIECQTIYISKKYPKMGILDLYRRIQNHLKKHYPNIYNKLNRDIRESSLNNSNKIKKDSIEIKLKDAKENKDEEILFRNIYKGRELTEMIQHINELNCIKINNIFESFKFEENIALKYDNCFVKQVICDKDESEISINSRKDDLSTSSNLSSSTNESFNKIRKIHFVTHLSNNNYRKRNFIRIEKL